MQCRRIQLKEKLKFAMNQNPRGEWQKWAKLADIKYKVNKMKGVKI